jgi:hypothetical protein
MFPSITPMVLLYNRLIRASGDSRDNTKDDMSHALVVEWDTYSHHFFNSISGYSTKQESSTSRK